MSETNVCIWTRKHFFFLFQQLRSPFVVFFCLIMCPFSFQWCTGVGCKPVSLAPVAMISQNVQNMFLHCLPGISKGLAWRCHLDGSIQSLHKENTPTLTSTVTHIYLPLIIFECYIVVFQNIYKYKYLVLSSFTKPKCRMWKTQYTLTASSK